MNGGFLHGLELPIDLPGDAAPPRMEDAQRLSATGNHAAAEAMFSALCRDAPDRPAAWTGLARSAEAQRDWQRAYDLWVGCMERFPGEAREAWSVGHAKSLLELGRRLEAFRAFRVAILRFPSSAAAAAGYARTLIELGRREFAAREVVWGSLRDTPGIGRLLARLRVFVWLNDREAAIAAHHAAFDMADRVSHLVTLFEMIPACFVRFERLAAWQRLDARLADMVPRDPLESETRITLQLRLRLALRDHAGFLRLHADSPPIRTAWGPQFDRLVPVLRAERYPDFHAPRVFGIGLTKTGTTSLTAALEVLGYATSHFRNNFTHAMLEDEDFFLFDAFADTPVAAQFERLYHMFPNARFVWTVRPLDPWVVSFRKHYMRHEGVKDYESFVRETTLRGISPGGADTAKVHAGLYLRHATPRAVWEAYELRVKRFFRDKPKNKLLRYDIFAGDGWPELCGFLDKPIPETPYPWENRAPGE